MVIEGMLALTGQHFIIDFNEREGTLPGFVQGFNLVARDEHRHVAFGARFLRDMVAEDPERKKVIQRMLEEALPVTDKVLTPPWAEGVAEDYEFFGVSIDETRDFAAQALTRRLEGHRARPGVRSVRPSGEGSLGALRRILLTLPCGPTPAPPAPPLLEVVRTLSVAGGMGRSYDVCASSGMEGSEDSSPSARKPTSVWQASACLYEGATVCT